MTVTYFPAPEAEKIGRQLIAKHHTDLIGERVDFVFRSEAQKTAGRVIWGKARKVSGLNAYLATVTGLGSAVNEFKKAVADVGGATVSAGGRTVEVGPPEDEAIDPFFVIELAHDVWDTLDGKRGRDSFAAWRHAIATTARAATGYQDLDGAEWPLVGPVVVCLTFGLQRPVSAPKTKRTWPCGARSGDLDKLSRCALDAITGVLVADDAQVVGLSVTKTYGRPGVRLQLWPETPEQLWVPSWYATCYTAPSLALVSA